MFKKHWVFFACLVILLVLLAKNPFSQRTLIPNFEPYPDTIHYIVPARSIAHGGDFAVTRENRSIKPGVPPLYSLFLTPFFVIYNDPRVFYFANILLSVAAFSLLYLILRKITDRSLVLFLALFLYATNYFIYWYPSLAMAENLTLFIFLLNLYLLMIKTNKYTIILGATIPFAFFLAKYANVPLTAIFLMAYILKLFFEKGKAREKKTKMKENFIWFGASLGVIMIVLMIAEVFPPLTTLTTLFANLLPHKATAKQTAVSGGGWFSLSYMKDHLPQYVKSLFGGYRLRFLWDDTPIWPAVVATPGVIGLIIGAFMKKIKLPMLVLLLSIIANVIFMSTFYSLDMRYLNYVIPTILIGFVVLIEFLFQKQAFQHNERVGEVIIYSLLAVLFIFYFATNVVRLKKQTMLNLKYAETPWYYISVLKLNEYFKNYPQNKKEPVVISSMIPYYIDFYSNGTYALLPMSKSQEFRNFMKEAWGDFDYSNLIMLYSKILYTGHEVFVSNYGIGNEKPLQEDFKKIQDNFILTKVADGCYGACNIWKLREKYRLIKIETKEND